MPSKRIQERLFWIILIGLYAFFYVTMIYADFAVTFEHGVLLCESIFSGDFFGFYEHATEGIYQNPAVYDIAIYLIWAIWCIPVYIVTRFVDIAYAASPICMLYGKAMIVAFHLGCAWLISKIGKEIELDDKKNKLLVLIYLTSLTVIIPEIGNGQFDLIPTFFILAGVLQYCKGNYKKFLIVMSFAVALKLFAVFLVIPLILLKEKRVWAVIRDVVISFVATAFFKLLFIGKTVDYSGELFMFSPDQYSNKWVWKMFQIQTNSGFGVVSLFILFFVLLCACAYFLKTSEQERNKMTILYAFLTYLNFFLFIETHAQWIVIFTPFICLFIFNNQENYRLNAIWATLMECLFIICYSYKFGTVFWGSNELRGLEKIIPFPEVQRLGGSLEGFINQLGVDYMIPGAVAALFAVSIMLIYQNFTKTKRFIEIPEEKFEEKFLAARIGLIIFYLITLLMFSYV